MTAPLGDLSVEDFVRGFWQQKPCLIRQAFPELQPELDENDVAGLACEELAESRLVTGSMQRGDWTLRHGPFREEELQQLPDSGWTLLVQDVEKHYPPLQALLARFDFIPAWRLDDLMISVSAEGGSVGPHVDQYDVFLLQASGRRRWQLARQFDPGLLPGCELNVLAGFNPEQEWELQAGDMLYLPPGVAHHGVALDTGMTWSIGLRAPSQSDLLLGLGEWLAERAGEGHRYRDGVLPPCSRRGEISRDALADLRQLMTDSLRSGEELDRFLASFLSRFRLAHLPAPPESRFNGNDLDLALAGPARLQHNPWTRMTWIEIDDGQASLFAAGEEYRCGVATAAALSTHPIDLGEQLPLDSATRTLICRLVNDGHLCFQS